VKHLQRTRPAENKGVKLGFWTSKTWPTRTKAHKKTREALSSKPLEFGWMLKRKNPMMQLHGFFSTHPRIQVSATLRSPNCFKKDVDKCNVPEI